MPIDDAWRYQLIGSLAEIVSNPLMVYHDINIHWRNVYLYQLEDGRFAVSVFDDTGKKHLSEELFTDPFVAAARFYAYVEAH